MTWNQPSGGAISITWYSLWKHPQWHNLRPKANIYNKRKAPKQAIRTLEFYVSPSTHWPCDLRQVLTFRGLSFCLH